MASSAAIPIDTLAAADRHAGTSASAHAPARHFPLLDAGRGVAALAVVVHHAAIQADLQIARHGHLAVDYFLMLSGFVVAMSYEAKLRDRMTFRAFLGVRAARLYPMIFLGSLLGALLWAIAPNPDIRFSAVLIEFVLVPTMTSWVIFPLNAPFWSLFYECIANAAHGALFAFARTRRLAVMAAVLAAGAATIALIRDNSDWGFRPGEEWIALVRVFAAYLAGVLMWRLYAAGRLPAWKAPAIVPMALILLPLLAPTGIGDGLVTVAALFVCFPLAILLALGGAERAGSWAAWLGGISYPLYAIHMPILLGGKALGLATGLVGWTLLALFAVAAASAVERWYDAPVRRALKAWRAPTA